MLSGAALGEYALGEFPPSHPLTQSVTLSLPAQTATLAALVQFYQALTLSLPSQAAVVLVGAVRGMTLKRPAVRVALRRAAATIKLRMHP